MSDNAPRRGRLLFLTEWFDPEHAFKGLRFAKALREKGYDVEVATAFPNYPGGKVYDGYRVRPYQRDTMDGLTVHRLFVLPSHDRSGLRRMVTYVSFFVSSLLFLLVAMRRYDRVYVYHPPIMPGLAAALAGLVHRRPFLLEIQDLWPDSVASSGMSQPWINRLLGRLCDFTYARAARIICQSDGMVERLLERGVAAGRLARIYNWSNYVPVDADPAGPGIPDTFEAAFAGRFNLVYGGNLGQAQALEHVIEAAALAARTVPALRLHLVGKGIVREPLAELARKRAPDHVLFHDAVSSIVMDRIFDRADGLILNLKDDPLYDITIPSKAQHYLSVGRPIIAGISGEAARLLRESGAARVVPNGDVEAMAEAMVALATGNAARREAQGRAGRAFYESRLSFEAAMETTDALIRAV